MIGATVGDIAGSRFEFNNIKTKKFDLLPDSCFFTDDTIMTLAVAAALLDSDCEPEAFKTACVDRMREYGLRHPDGGYGGGFAYWLVCPYPIPYNSWGNGSAMRVSPCGWAAKSLEEALTLAEISAAVTHNHPEGIKGAQATAAAVYLARNGKSKQEIRDYITANFYALDFTLDGIRDEYTFTEACKDTAPQAIEAFLESEDFEDAIRNAVSIGGDSDTLAAITGGIAEAFYGVPGSIRERALSFLSDDLLSTLNAFEEKYGTPRSESDNK